MLRGARSLGLLLVLVGQGGKLGCRSFWLLGRGG